MIDLQQQLKKTSYKIDISWKTRLFPFEFSINQNGVKSLLPMVESIMSELSVSRTIWSNLVPSSVPSGGFCFLHFFSGFSCGWCSFIQSQLLQFFQETINFWIADFIWTMQRAGEWAICHFFLVLQKSFVDHIPHMSVLLAEFRCDLQLRINGIWVYDYMSYLS